MRSSVSAFEISSQSLPCCSWCEALPRRFGKLARRAFRTLRVPIDLYQLYEASLIIGSLWLLRMAHSECRLNVDLVRSESAECGQAVASARRPDCILRGGLVCATHNFRE